ncbi:hypothetical protein A6S26_32835 [Nostoc sp. ATCC 43529]|nr:hypothetical protein A6S26_32835 [Nostoc sp. ATCC 43529]
MIPLESKRLISSSTIKMLIQNLIQNQAAFLGILIGFNLRKEVRIKWEELTKMITDLINNNLVKNLLKSTLQAFRLSSYLLIHPLEIIPILKKECDRYRLLNPCSVGFLNFEF